MKWYVSVGYYKFMFDRGEDACAFAETAKESAERAEDDATVEIVLKSDKEYEDILRIREESKKGE